MVAGLTILRLVDQGFLTLDSTTGDVLGWTGPQAAITLRQLLSFTSGLPREALCTLTQNTTLADCVDSISQMTLVAAPGTRFDYGSTHLHVAARMAEVVTGQAWANVFQAQLKTPLGLGADMAWYSAPRQGMGTTNPLIAGGLRATMNEYARVLQLEFNRGMYQGNRLDLRFAVRLRRPPSHIPTATIGNSPFANTGLNFHYGLAAWLECTAAGGELRGVVIAGRVRLHAVGGSRRRLLRHHRDGSDRVAVGDRGVLRAAGAGPQAPDPRRPVNGDIPTVYLSTVVRIDRDIVDKETAECPHLHDLAAGDAALELHAARRLAAETQQCAVALLHQRGGGLAAHALVGALGSLKRLEHGVGTRVDFVRQARRALRRTLRSAITSTIWISLACFCVDAGHVDGQRRVLRIHHHGEAQRLAC